MFWLPRPAAAPHTMPGQRNPPTTSPGRQAWPTYQATAGGGDAPGSSLCQADTKPPTRKVQRCPLLVVHHVDVLADGNEVLARLLIAIPAGAGQRICR